MGRNCSLTLFGKGDGEYATLRGVVSHIDSASMHGDIFIHYMKTYSAACIGTLIGMRLIETVEDVLFVFIKNAPSCVCHLDDHVLPSMGE